MQVEKVVEAMGVSEPHLLLRFSRVRTSLQRWNNFWDFDKSGDNTVDENELPFTLPPGMSREKSEIAEYLCSIAQDRVHNILHGVSQACNQAGAWLELSCFDEGATPYGLIDHIGPLLGAASDKQSIIFSTYSLEERRKTNGEESERFVQSLLDFCGEKGHSDGRSRPRMFKYDITAEMRDLELDPEISPKHLWQKALSLKGKMRVGKSPDASKTPELSSKPEEAARFWEVVKQRSSDKRYLPAKDLTHLLCFESKACEMKFRDLLESRTPVGNFIMEGTVQAARLFNDSIKQGTPVFVVKGSGGASDKLSLVLDHMKWRSQLDFEEEERQETVNEDPEDHDEENRNQGCCAFLTSCFGETKTKRNRNHEEGDNEAANGADDDVEDFNKWAAPDFVIERLQEKYKKVEAEMKEKQDAGAFDQALPKKLIMNQVHITLSEALALQERMQRAITVACQTIESASMEEGAGKRGDFDEDLVQIQKDYARLLDDYDNKIRDDYDPMEDADHARSTAGSDVGTKVSACDNGSNGRTRSLQVTSDPEQLYNDDLRIGKEGLFWELRNQRFEPWYTRYGDHPESYAGSQPPPEWWLPFEGDKIRCKKPMGYVCNEERRTCPYCGAAKSKYRRSLRFLARKNKRWMELDKETRSKYIRKWRDHNSLDDEGLMLKGGSRPQKDETSELCRVIFQVSAEYIPATLNALVYVRAV